MNRLFARVLRLFAGDKGIGTLQSVGLTAVAAVLLTTSVVAVTGNAEPIKSAFTSAGQNQEALYEGRGKLPPGMVDAQGKSTSASIDLRAASTASPTGSNKPENKDQKPGREWYENLGRLGSGIETLADLIEGALEGFTRPTITSVVVEVANQWLQENSERHPWLAFLAPFVDMLDKGADLAFINLLFNPATWGWLSVLSLVGISIGFIGEALHFWQLADREFGILGKLDRVIAIIAAAIAGLTLVMAGAIALFLLGLVALATASAVVTIAAVLVVIGVGIYLFLKYVVRPDISSKSVVTMSP